MSASCTPCMNPVCRARHATRSGNLGCAGTFQRLAGTSVITFCPHVPMSIIDACDETPEGNTALRPSIDTPSADTVDEGSSDGAISVRRGTSSSSGFSRVASSRAVGWSKTSVLGSILSLPAADCNWLRNSTAPSESTPASIRGASASIEPPAVRVAISNTIAREIVHLPPSAARFAILRPLSLGLKGDRSAGTSVLPPKYLFHSTGINANTGGAPSRTPK